MVYESRPYGEGDGADIRGNIYAGSPVPDGGWQAPLAFVIQETLRVAAGAGVEWDDPALEADLNFMTEEHAAVVEVEAARLSWRYARIERFQPTSPPREGGISIRLPGVD